MTVMIFIIGALLGVLCGGALCVRYLRHEVAADISPKLRLIQLQLDNVEAELSLALATRRTELNEPQRRKHTFSNGD